MVTTRKRRHSTTYYARFAEPGGRWVEERVGANKREAERLEAQRKREVEAGTYQRGGSTAGITFATYAKRWLDGRRNKCKADDAQRLNTHVLPVIGKIPLRELRPRQCLDLIKSLLTKGMNPKTVQNTWSALKTCLRDAMYEDLITWQLSLPKGVIPTVQAPVLELYPGDDVLLLSHSAQCDETRILSAIVFYTGMREGEACGLRWSDWDESPQPLGALLVERQYDGIGRYATTKTGKARLVPVHPLLADELRAWKQFQSPMPGDPIVPRRPREHHNKDSARQCLIRHCRVYGVTYRGVHRTRHTAITAMRRGGAPRDVVQQITHGKGQNIVDRYTHDWTILCAGVSCIDYSGRGVSRGALVKTSAIAQLLPGERPGSTTGHKQTAEEFSGQHANNAAPNSPSFSHDDATRGARREHLHTGVACWHCGDVLIQDKWDVPRCERCPAPLDCDDEDCEHCAGNHEDKAYEALEAFQSHPRRPYRYQTPAGDVYSWARCPPLPQISAGEVNQ